MNRLRCETEMAHHRDSHSHQTFNHRQNLRFRPFELHGCCAGVLEQAACGCHSLIEPALIAQKREIADHKRLLLKRAAESPTHRLGVMKDLFNGHRQRGGMAENNHGQRIAHQHHVCSCGFNQAGAESIPGCEDRDWLTDLFEPNQLARPH